VRKLNAAILLLVVAISAHGEWKIVSTQTEPSRASVLEHRHVVLKDVETSDNAIIDLATGNPSERRLARATESAFSNRLCHGHKVNAALQFRVYIFAVEP
jgi:hypothetical protein